jgi:hypothetical protein
MEIWARCGSCARWFHCPHDARRETGWHCPVCGSDPVALENRAGANHTSLVRISWPLDRPEQVYQPS